MTAVSSFLADMAHKDYKDTGVRIMQTEAGDLMLVGRDGRTLQIPGKDVEDSLWKERAAYLNIRHIIRFVRDNAAPEAAVQKGS